jgi:hypothetical protein
MPLRMRVWMARVPFQTTFDAVHRSKLVCDLARGLYVGPAIASMRATCWSRL